MPAGRRLVESPRVGEEHLAAGGHGTPPRNAAQFNGFYVVAPEAQINAGVFASLVTKESIEEKVRRRAAQFGGGATEWIDKTFMLYFAALKVGLVSWEQIIAEMSSGSFAREYNRFYEMCCSFVPRLRSAA